MSLEELKLVILEYRMAKKKYDGLFASASDAAKLRDKAYLDLQELGHRKQAAMDKFMAGLEVEVVPSDGSSYEGVEVSK